eukprot:10003753-Alexandrium_andersonii.AAC.1
MEHCSKLDRPPTRPAQDCKPLNWLTKTQSQWVQDNFLGGCDPPEAVPVSADTQLDFAEVSLGCLE